MLFSQKIFSMLSSVLEYTVQGHKISLHEEIIIKALCGVCSILKSIRTSRENI